MQKVISKSGLVFVCILYLLLSIFYCPIPVEAAKASKNEKKPTHEIRSADQWQSAPKAFFDANKMSDMSDFDPANAVIPTGDTIKIAIMQPFSGPGASVGNAFWLVVNWAAHDINKRGGIWVDGKKKLIEPIKGDTMAKPDQCKKIAERLATQEKVHVFLGASGSHLMKIINQVANQYKIISVNQNSVGEDLQDATNFSRYAFQLSVTAEQSGRAFGYFYGQIRKKEKKFYILCHDTSGGRDLAAAFKKGLDEYYPGAQIVGEDYHKPFLTDFAPYLTKIKASGAEVIFTSDWPPDVSNLLKQARQMKINIPLAHLFLTDPKLLSQVGIEGSKGLIYLDQINTEPPLFKTPEQIKFYKAWNGQWKKWKTSPFNDVTYMHGTGMQNFWLMQVYWLFSAIERAKSTNAEKIIEVWENDTYRTLYGKVFKMRACDHMTIQDLLIYEYVSPKEQKISFNIPPYYFSNECSTYGPGWRIPAGKILPQVDQKHDRCKGKNNWGE
jgi:ABC-type branched-subunit amino acid transport system substrate-binding protein